MERHSVRGARSDLPTERCRPEARRSESAAFSHGMPWRHPPLPPLHCENPRAQFKPPMHCDASAGTPPAPRTPPTTRPNRARTLPHLSFVHSRRAMTPSARRKNKGTLRENTEALRKKQGTFLKQTGTLHHYPRSNLITPPTKSTKQQVHTINTPSAC